MPLSRKPRSTGSSMSLKKPLGLLIVEDCESDAELLLLELRRGGYDPSFERVETAPAMGAALDAASRSG